MTLNSASRTASFALIAVAVVALSSAAVPYVLLMLGQERLPLVVFLLQAGIVLLLLPVIWAVRKQEVQELSLLMDDMILAVPAKARGSLEGSLVEKLGSTGRSIVSRLLVLEKDAERHLTSSRLQAYRREKIEAVLEALPDGLVLLDEEGLAAFSNDKIAPLTGADPRSITGRGVSDWQVTAESRAAIVELLASFQNNSGSMVHFFPDAEGDRRITIIARAVFSPHSPERRLGILLLLRETTEEWLAYKGRDEFIAHVAHELKTPLGNVTLYGEQLRNLVDATDAFAVECANTICDEADRMVRLINNLLDISRIEAGTLSLDLQRVRLHDLLEDCMETVLYAAKAKGLSTRLQIPPDMAPASLDKSLIRVAISNLLNNAVKYNREGGEVILSAEDSVEGVVISVQDTGIGIAEEDIHHLFEKYFRSTDQDAVACGGHGLGLYLVKRIADLHHGRIQVSSTLGAGSRFQLIIPTTQVLL